jgi:hypothetical protein
VVESAKRRYLPNADRLSVLAAIILLAYALTPFVELPGRSLSIEIPGFFLSIEINLRTLVASLVACLTATGADWLLRDHPAIGDGPTVQHWLLPSLTAWVLGIPLFQLPFGAMWWAVFAIGGVLLMMVLVAEYIVVDPEDIRYAPASAGLIAVSFALFLTLAIVLHSAGTRLFLILPALMLAGGLVSLRTLRLRSQSGWKILEALMIVLIVGQVTAALHYWPLSSISFGLAVLGPTYSLTTLVSGLDEGKPLRQALLEPTVVLLVVLVAALWIH